MITTAYVKIWGERAGALAWDSSSGLGSFEYDRSYLEKGWDLAPIKMPITAGAQIYTFPELMKGRNEVYDTFYGLPGLLADSLPDKYGHQLMDNWLIRQGRSAGSMNPIEKLCFIGSRGVGALEFEPAQLTGEDKSYKIELDTMVEMSQKMLRKRSDFQTDLSKDDEKAMIDILKIGTSAGGARPKAVITYNDETGEVRSGQHNAAKGFEHWLIKLDGVSDAQFGESSGYGRVEMAYYYMAIDCGIDMMECRLIEENGRAHFMTKRYDREGGNIRHHAQTWCAINHYNFNDMNSYSYEHLFQTMRALRLDYKQAEEMFRRMVFNVLARNCDDHTKNFSFLLKKDASWRISPAYDICHAYRPDSFWVSQHALSINGKRKNHSIEDFLTIAKSMNIKKAKDIIDDVIQTVKKWPAFAEQVNLSSEKMIDIQKTFVEV